VVGTIHALFAGNLRRSVAKEFFMPEICEQCGSGVVKKLLQRNDGTAVLHRECINGHKHHRITRDDDAQTADPQRDSTSFVIIEACDCN
jgi:hypothetical protein